MGRFQTDEMHDPSAVLKDFLVEQRLPSHYAEIASQWFLPLADALARFRAAAGRPLILGINGSQGSGKSTLAALLRTLFAARHGLSAIDLSIDDFYLPRNRRRQLADEVHPLLITRGVPGTHDIPLMRHTLRALTVGHGPVAIPRFDKANDDRVPKARWEKANAPLDMVIVEGWCLGTPPQDEQDLQIPVNLLEANEDPDGRWRRYVNDQLRKNYQPIYQQVDAWVMLKAPSFDSVFQWRLEQEKKLAERLQQDPAPKRIMSPDDLARFIEHYQRLTTHTLRTLPESVHFLFELDADRHIRSASTPRELPAA